MVHNLVSFRILQHLAIECCIVPSQTLYNVDKQIIPQPPKDSAHQQHQAARFQPHSCQFETQQSILPTITVDAESIPTPPTPWGYKRTDIRLQTCPCENNSTKVKSHSAEQHENQTGSRLPTGPSKAVLQAHENNLVVVSRICHIHNLIICFEMIWWWVYVIKRNKLKNK
jgi:hypothetical protein